jgi:putative OPT family oligopeptide transporter
VGIISIPTFILFFTLINDGNYNLSSLLFWGLVLFSTVFTLIVGFICAAIAAYVVGIVGTTSLPISGITIAAIIAFSIFLLALLGNQIDFAVNSELALKAGAMVIVFATIVCVAAAVSGDNMQDLKAGQIVGATPWKQQAMLAVGAIASAIVIPFILQTTFEAYGIGDVMPRIGMDPNQALPAPQATLMATVVKGFFGGQLPWLEIFWGMGIAVAAIILDEVLKRSKTGYRFPPLLLALGIYLPLGYVTAFFVGGIINFLVSLKRSDKAMHDESNNKGLLFASGLIAGEAILGAILTIPFAYYQSTDIFALKMQWLAPYQDWITVLLYLGMCFALYHYSVQKQKLKQTGPS